jgi:MFS family permease
MVNDDHPSGIESGSRGLAMPPWTNFARACAIGVSAMIGAVVAVMADLVQKEAASAVLKITGIANVHLGLIVSPLLWALGLVLLGVALCFVFEPATKKAAFYLGASIIALVMTAIPFQTPPTMVTPEVEGQGEEASLRRLVVLAGLKAWPQIAEAGARKLEVVVTVTAQPGGEPGPLLLSLFDEATGKQWRYSSSVRPGETATHVWLFPKNGHRRSFILRAEAKGYGIKEVTKAVPAGARQARLEVVLEPTSRPSWLETLLAPRSF